MHIISTKLDKYQLELIPKILMTVKTLSCDIDLNELFKNQEAYYAKTKD